MSKIFITGSADGLGQMAAALLVGEGHEVVLHARNKERGTEAMKRTPGAKAVLIADLTSLDETIDLSRQANALGSFDAVIHNAGVYQASPKQIFAVNTQAPYVLTSLIQKPKRLVYLSSGLHFGGRVGLERITKGETSYSDSKLHVMMFALAVSRRWPNIYANAVDPGWVPTKMGGRGAPDDLQKGCETQAWLAVSDDESAKVSGRYFFHQTERAHNPLADDTTAQNQLFLALKAISGVEL